MIDRCYVTEDSIINVTNKSSSSSTLKGAIAGGISAVVEYSSIQGLDRAQVTNSYSLATIRVTKAGDASAVGYLVGGLVGSLTASSKIEVTNCYVVVKIVKDVVSGSSIKVYEMLPQTSLVVLRDNYYIVEKCELTKADASLDTDGCKLLADATALKSKVATLKDKDNKQVYVVTDTDYPTLYKGE